MGDTTMSYIQKNLMRNEKVLLIARVHPPCLVDVLQYNQ